MKILVLALMFFSVTAFAQSDAKPEKNPKAQTVKAACGMCLFGLEGTACALAVKIDDKAYYVDGIKLGDYGDAHAEDGMCKKVRDAEIVGELVDGRFKATEFKLLPLKEKESE